MNFSEVLQTAPTDASGGPEPEARGIGDMFGHGIAGVKSNTYRKFFEEHGYVITMLSVRPKSICVYDNVGPGGVHRFVLAFAFGVDSDIFAGDRGGFYVGTGADWEGHFWTLLGPRSCGGEIIFLPRDFFGEQ